MYETLVTVAGNVVDDVELRTTQSGRKLALFTVACTPRYQEPGSRTWIDGHTSFYAVKCWNGLAQNVADSLAKGLPVVVYGRLTQRTFAREVGNVTVRNTKIEITALSVGPDLSRGVAEFRRTKSQAVRRAEERALAEAHLAQAGQDSG